MHNSDLNATTSDEDKAQHDQAQSLAQVPSVGCAGTRALFEDNEGTRYALGQWDDDAAASQS
jgi:hypothetical protein